MHTKGSKNWLDEIWNRKTAFFAVFMLVLFVTYGILFAIDFIPESQKKVADAEPLAIVTTSTPTVAVSNVTPILTPTSRPVVDATVDPNPKKLIIDAIDRTVTVLNPTNSSVEALDTALLSGAIRHPQSASFAKVGTMFLVGHSSYLPLVHNKNYQTFNDIQKLVWGDVIRLQSSNREYVYKVSKVYEAKASNAEVDIQWEKPTLILATCNSFASKDDRFIVEASFVESYPIDAHGKKM